MAKKIYLDTEFLEGKQQKRFLGLKIGQTKPTIDLISIGMVDEKGNEYYSISKDFNLKDAWNRYDIKTEQVYGDQRNIFLNGKKTKVYWIRENVIRPIFNDLVEKHWLKAPFLADSDFSYANMKKLLKIYGKSNEQIKEEIHDFCLDSFVEMMMGPCNKVQLYGYYSAYDHVCLCWLFGKMIDLPEGFPMYTIDLKQMLDENAEKWIEGGDEKMSIKEVVEHWKINDNFPKQENEHSAIHDARWNKKLHKFLNNL